jgi:hypothetical protein
MDQIGSNLSAKTAQAIGLLLIIALTVLTFLLAFENRKLKSQIESIVRPRDVLKRGDLLTAIEVRTLEDSTVEIHPSPSNRGNLCVILSTTCPACEVSIPFMKGVVRYAQESGFEAMFISIHARERTRAFADRHGIESSIYVGADSLTRVKLKANAVPQTILTSSKGIVRYNWVGLIDSLKQREILDSLRLIGSEE